MSDGWNIADLPLILILSVYTDFLLLEFGKVQIFFLEIWQNTDFFKECERVFFIFSLFIQIFFPKILIFLVIYTDFVLPQSGRSDIVAIVLAQLRGVQAFVTCMPIYQKDKGLPDVLGAGDEGVS